MELVGCNICLPTVKIHNYFQANFYIYRWTAHCGYDCRWIGLAYAFDFATQHVSSFCIVCARSREYCKRTSTLHYQWPSFLFSFAVMYQVASLNEEKEYNICNHASPCSYGESLGKVYSMFLSNPRASQLRQESTRPLPVRTAPAATTIQSALLFTDHAHPSAVVTSTLVGPPLARNEALGTDSV